MEKVRQIIPIVLAMLVSVGAAVLAHEVAHLVVALILGWKIKTLQIGPFEISGGRPQYHRGWHPGSLLLRPDTMVLSRFARELRLVVIAGPTINILIGLAALASRNVLAEAFGGMQLAIGLWNLIPSTRHNAPLGNDGNIAFRVCKDEGLLQKLYFESINTSAE